MLIFLNFKSYFLFLTLFLNFTPAVKNTHIHIVVLDFNYGCSDDEFEIQIASQRKTSKIRFTAHQ